MCCVCVCVGGGGVCLVCVCVWVVVCVPVCVCVSHSLLKCAFRSTFVGKMQSHYAHTEAAGLVHLEIHLSS